MNNVAGHMVHPYTLPLTLDPMEGSGCSLTPRLDLDGSSLSSERDPASPLDSEGSSLYFEREANYSVRNLAGFSEEARRSVVYSEVEEEAEVYSVARSVYSEEEAERYSVAPVLDSEADSGTGSVCEEEADDAQDQVGKPI